MRKCRDKKRKRIYRELGLGVYKHNLEDPELIEALELKYGMSYKKIKHIINWRDSDWYKSLYKKRT